MCVCAFPAGAALGGDCRSVELAVFSLAPRIEYCSEYDQTTTISLPPRTDGREEMRASVVEQRGLALLTRITAQEFAGCRRVFFTQFPTVKKLTKFVFRVSVARVKHVKYRLQSQCVAFAWDRVCVLEYRQCSTVVESSGLR